MKKTFILFSLFFSTHTFVHAQKKFNLGKIVNDVAKATQNVGLSNDDIVMGLKEALQNGINKGADSASKENGFYLNPKIKIPFPPEVQKVESTLRSLGLGNEVDKFLLSLNRGAENAAKEAKPIFMKALFSMSFTDALSILRGDKNAATLYLQKTTSADLIKTFSPIVEKALQQTEATKYYSDIAKTYNALPFVKKVNPDLNAYATQKAVDGLFILVAEEEAKIRENPLARTSDLLKKVFAN